MSPQRANPFPSLLAEEGAARRRRGAGQRTLTLTKAARQLRSRLTDVLTTLAAVLNKTPHPSSSLRSTPPPPARGEGKQGEI
jgi:hypothetical protein